MSLHSIRESVGRATQAVVEISQHPGDAGVLAKAMKIFHQQNGWTVGIEFLEPLQDRHRLSASQSIGIEDAAEALDEVPTGEPALQPFRGLLDERRDAILLTAPNPDQWCSRSNQQVEMITPLVNACLLYTSDAADE